MATTINASTNGLTHSADTSSILGLQTAGITALSVLSNQFVNITTPTTEISSNSAPLYIGSPLNFNDANTSVVITNNINGYAQLVLQNRSTGTTASADIVVNNDSTNGANVYGNFGINSTTFNGSDPFSDATGTYVLGSNSSLTLGTTGSSSKNVRVATNGNIVMTAYAANTNVAFSGGITATSLNLFGSYVPTDNLGGNVANNQVFLRGDQTWQPLSVPNFPTQLSSLGVGTTPPGTTGQIYATNSITAYYSDARLKTIKHIIPNALDKLLSLTGVIFTQNEKAEEFGYSDYCDQVGIIAQEVERVLPEAVKLAPFDLDQNGESKSGENYLTVQYEKIVPLLIEAIKEQQIQIEELKSKLNS